MSKPPVMTRWKGHGKSSSGAGVIWLLLIVPMVSTLCWGGYRVYSGVTFGIDCKGHLKLAADANTIALAQERLGMALEYLEANDMTSGFTSVVYTGPEDDVKFWYNNLNDSRTELDSMPEDASPLERSNMLMKLRETLLDNVSVTVPPGIAIFPNNVVVAWWGGISLSLLFILGIAAGFQGEGRPVEVLVVISIIALMMSMVAGRI